MSRWGLYLSVVALTLFALGVGGLNFLYRWRVRPHLDSQIATQKQYLPAFNEDQIYLSKNATELGLGASGGSSDAGPYLNPRMLWTPVSASSKATAIVAEPIRVELLRTGRDWILNIAKGRYPKSDLSFFSELAKFDYWDIETGSPLAELVRSRAFVPPPQIPLPDTGDILSAVKLRLIKGGLDKDFVPALRDARQMGRLLLSTENLQLVLAGLLIFDFERRAYRAYVDDIKMNPKLWTPIDTNVTRRARRAALATRAYLRLWTPTEILDKEFLGSTVPPAFCAAVNEAIPFDYSLRRLLEPHFPFEMDTRSEYARLDRIVTAARKKCRLRYLSSILGFVGPALASGENATDEATNESSIRVRVPGPLLFNDLPYSRKIFGLRLSGADLGGFDDYGKQAAGTD